MLRSPPPIKTHVLLLSPRRQCLATVARQKPGPLQKTAQKIMALYHYYYERYCCCWRCYLLRCLLQQLLRQVLVLCQDNLPPQRLAIMVALVLKLFLARVRVPVPLLPILPKRATRIWKRVGKKGEEPMSAYLHI